MQLILDSLVIHRGDRLVIAGVSETVRAGEALILRGPNGAGKTTLIRAIAGFLRPTSGAARLEGGAEDTPLPEQCHYIGHLNGVKANLTVAENLDFWSGYLDPAASRAERAARLDRALAIFNLAALEDIPAAYLSAGQKRRVGLARLCLAHRPVWLLDEPTVSLDAASVAILADAVARHVEAGGLVLAATHIPLGIETARTLELAPASASAAVASGEIAGDYWAEGL